MKGRRTHESNFCYRLEGGNEDNDLWVRVHEPETINSDESRQFYGDRAVSSVWELTDDERAQVADGANIELTVWGGQPPVSMAVTTVALGKPPGDHE